MNDNDETLAVSLRELRLTLMQGGVFAVWVLGAPAVLTSLYVHKTDQPPASTSTCQRPVSGLGFNLATLKYIHCVTPS
jgi:hypothetical protein